MTITGIMPLRNAVKLGYPFELAVRSLARLCDETIIGVDPTSEDDTMKRVASLAPSRIVESAWDMTNHRGHKGESEIARQTAILCDEARGDWIFSLQADELIHERDVATIRLLVDWASSTNVVTGLEFPRYYFWGLDRMRENWTVSLLRLFKRGCWQPDGFSGAMQFVPVDNQARRVCDGAGIYHYSRVGDPRLIAQRVRNLDTFYHDPKLVADADSIAPYAFEPRKLDTYVIGYRAEPDPDAGLVPFPLHAHPEGVLEHFGATL